MWAMRKAMMTSWLTRGAGAIVAAIGLAVCLSCVFGDSHIDDGRHATAFVRWHKNPTPDTEAAWARARRRRLLEEVAIILAGGAAAIVGVRLASGRCGRARRGTA